MISAQSCGSSPLGPACSTDTKMSRGSMAMPSCANLPGSFLCQDAQRVGAVAVPGLSNVLDDSTTEQITGTRRPPLGVGTPFGARWTTA